jgi:hypothetical protein
MLPHDLTTLALAIVSTLILVRLLLPNVLAILGVSALQNGLSGGPEDANSYWPSVVDADLYQGMLALGFQPEGTYWEQMPFTRRFEEFVFTRPGEKCFGILYPNDQIMPRRASFMTVFETGGVVFTKNYSGGVEVQEGDFLATGGQTDLARQPTAPAAPAGSSWKLIVSAVAAGLLTAMLFQGLDGWQSSEQAVMPWVLSGSVVIGSLLLSLLRGATPPRPQQQTGDLDLRIPLAETLARHRLNMNRLLAQGQQLPASFDGQEFLATQHRYYRHPRLRGEHQLAMSMLLVSKLIVLAPLPAIFFCSLGADDPLPWSILFAEGLVGLYLRYGCSSAQVINFLRGRIKTRSA